MGFSPGLPEMMIVGIIALLLFGKRLPEVARNLGKGLSEFKRGMTGIESDIDSASRSSSYSSSRSRPEPEEERDEVTAPKFEPPAAPADETSESEAVAEAENDADKQTVS